MAENKIAGHEWVDLGLPSGLKWATCNVGANTPEEFGFFFSWGETTRLKKSYNHENSINYVKSFKKLNNQGIIDMNGNLLSQHDAAHSFWGMTWRLPTVDEIVELINHTSSEWTKRNHLNGCLIISRKNGNSIFLPAAGCFSERAYHYLDEHCFYWSSSVDKGDSNYAYALSINEEHFPEQDS